MLPERVRPASSPAPDSRPPTCATAARRSCSFRGSLCLHNRRSRRSRSIRADLVEYMFQTATRSIQAQPKGDRRTTENGRRLRSRQTFPSVEQEHLAVGLCQSSQRLHHQALRADGATGVEALRASTFKERVTTDIRPPRIGNHTTRNTEKPRELLPRHIVQPPPRNQESLRKRIFRTRRIPTAAVRQHGASMRPIESLEPIRRKCRPMPSPTYLLSGTTLFVSTLRANTKAQP